MATLIVVCVIAIICQAFGNPVPSPEYDVIVVGLGASGTAAATSIAKAGKKVLALEAQDRIGGRVKTVKWGSGTVEEGAEWIHGTTNSTTYRLAQENNVTILQQNISFSVFRSDGSQYDSKVVRDLVDFSVGVRDEPPKTPEPLGKYITRRLQQYVAEKHPAVQNDTDFLNEFYKFMDLVIQTYDACDNWNELTTTSAAEDLEGVQEMSWHKYGYKTLFDILLNKYNNGTGIRNLEIKLSTEVSNIEWSPDGSRDVVVTTADGDTYTATRVIVTPSLGVLKAKYKTLFTPALPKEKEDAINNISFGICSKVILRFSENWWGGDHGIAFIWKGDDRKKLSEEDLWMTGNDGIFPPMSVNDTLTTWFCGERAKKVEAMPNDELQRKIMEIIRRFVSKEYDAKEPLEIMKSTWYTNPYVRGAYSFDNLSTPQHPDARAHLAAPLKDSNGIPRVLFAGEATEPRHFSTVHGALDTGFREARRVLDG